MRKMNPLRFLYLFFLSTIIANKRLLNCARDHKNRMADHNGSGIYTLAIASIDTVINDYGIAIGDTRSTVQVQKGATATKNGIIHDFSVFMHVEESHLAYVLRNIPGAYGEFYGNGMDEFNNISDENALALMESIKTAAGNHVAEVGVPFRDACNDFVTHYIAARDGQEIKFSTSGQARNLVKSKKLALVGLLVSDHGIIITNNTDLDSAEEIFNYSLLYRHRSTNHVHFPPHGSTTGVPNTVTNAGEIVVDDATEVTIHNEAAGDIEVYFSDKINGLPGLLKKTVHGFSSATVNVTLIDGDGTKPFLNVFAVNLTETPIWRLDVHDEL